MLSQIREQLLNVWRHQTPVQRILLISLVVAALIFIPIFINWANTPNYAVAFSGLSEEDAAQIVQTLTDQNVRYQLRNSTTILVPTNQVYEVRLMMAREGLPKGGNVGFELFSGNTLGMTEFTQKVNYQRALEGELERTIGSMEAIQAVRVHIVTPEKSLLSEDQNPTTASITIQVKAGYSLEKSQIRSITHLVSSSVEGLKADNVVVVDVNGNLLASGTPNGEEVVSALNDTHRAAEMAAATDLQKKVQNLLESALGPNRSVVQASVSMDWTQRETTTEGYDPLQSSVRSSQTVTEIYTTTAGLVGGIPGASSNIPPVATASPNSNQGTQYQRNEHTTNYEITQTKTHEVLAPGKIDRISLSVLVDGITDTVQLDKLQTVIAAAAGIDQTRGDTLAVQSLAFDRSFYKQQATEMESSQQYDFYLKIAEVIIGVLIVLGLLWYVQRLLANLRLASSQAWTPILKPVSEVALPSPAAAAVPAAMGAFPGMAQMPEGMIPGALPPMPPIPEMEAAPPPPRISIPLPQPEVMSEEEEQLKRLIIQMAEENPSAVAEIIQMWLNEGNR